MNHKKTNHKTIATLLALIPGFGHFYNRQYWQGGAILAVLAAYVYLTMNTVIQGTQGGGIAGLFTLGTVPGQDHSLFFLVEGLFSLFLIAVGLGIYLFSIYDARKNGRRRDEGEPLYSMRDQYKAVMNRGFPYLIMAPGLIAMALAVVFPIITTVMISMTNYNINHMPPKKLFSWVGLKNYADMFTMDSWKNALLYTLSWTLIWTVCATLLTIVMGILVAVIVNQKEIRFKKFWRTIIILPWAVPAFISILMFAVFFNDSFGAMNQQVIPFFDKLLPFVELEALPWKTQVAYTRLALILIQGWLGFPYIFVMVTGVFQPVSAVPQHHPSVDPFRDSAGADHSVYLQLLQLQYYLPLQQRRPCHCRPAYRRHGSAGVVGLQNHHGKRYPRIRHGRGHHCVRFAHRHGDCFDAVCPDRCIQGRE